MDLKNINLMNDALFKAIMCHENSREMVVDFIHGVTRIKKEILKSGVFIGGEEIPKRRIFTKKQMTDFTVNIEKQAEDYYRDESKKRYKHL